ncbi:MAG: 4-alpha-glucanotransferase [Clostridia bacterium]|nr:4-alpha-glucanotransferase [Clostridia bacterium]MDD4048549.1 4-alpha-glucanotransferase [Clostridia bacterium]
MDRAGGIILHPTSLPSKYGIGELGQEALEFIDFLKRSGMKVWQILPLNPVGYGESPYQSFSAFAGNPLLISLDRLMEKGLLERKELDDVPCFPDDRVNFQACREYKERMLYKAYKRFSMEEIKRSDYRNFLDKNHYWLPDYALYMALKMCFQNKSWNNWSRPIARREPQAVKYWEEKLEGKINYHNFLQYEFFSQWSVIREYAQEQGVKIIGDLPLYVAYDSSDAWVNSHLFELDSLGNPLKVGGVPPDYFCNTGQLWGNPIYKWDEMAKDDYLWWRERFKALLNIVDIIRVDHFRGFESYWEIPGYEETAVNGKWIKGPGEKFFFVIFDYLGQLPIIAEDLGIITSEVVNLKNKLNFPGMKVLQFIDKEPLTTPNDGDNYVYYTGTHDNDTLLGWYEKNVLSCLHPKRQKKLRKDVCWECIEIVLQSPARLAIIPLQDILCLNSQARMNTPSTVGGNWEWRYKKEDLTKGIEERLLNLVKKYDR